VKRTFIPAVATVMVVVAMARMPYGYYILLRLGLCAACVYYAFRAGQLRALGHRFALGALAVLYNPIVPVHLGSKGLWTVVNIGTVFYFWLLESREVTVPLKDERGSEP
jgi:hypothetical protein